MTATANRSVALRMNTACGAASGLSHRALPKLDLSLRSSNLSWHARYGRLASAAR